MMNNTNVNVTRYEFGVVIDLLPDMPARKVRDRISDVRDQAVRMNYVNLEIAAMDRYNRSYDLFVQGRFRYEPKLTTERYSLLTKSAGLLVLTHRYNKVKWEVSTALAHGTSVAILKPFGNPDMVKPKSVAEWDLMCERESNPDWSAWMDELDINLRSILSTPTPWLQCATLGSMASQYKDFDEFLDYLSATMHSIESTGEWDVDTSTSVVYNEKASVAHYVANKGMDKGKRTCSSSYKYGKKEFWYNYEVLPVDILTKFLHLSYLNSINYKPLVRIASDGVDYGKLIYTEFTEDNDSELGLSLTPLYEDPYFVHEGEAE
jgi:hypothetical protein